MNLNKEWRVVVTGVGYLADLKVSPLRGLQRTKLKKRFVYILYICTTSIFVAIEYLKLLWFMISNDYKLEFNSRKVQKMQNLNNVYICGVLMYVFYYPPLRKTRYFVQIRPIRR